MRKRYTRAVQTGEIAEEAEARKKLEKMLWPKGPVCPHCGSVNEADPLRPKQSAKNQHVRPGVWKCRRRDCRKQFTVTVKTPYERVRSIATLLRAIEIMREAGEKQPTIEQLADLLQVSLATAWRLRRVILASKSAKGRTT